MDRASPEIASATILKSKFNAPELRSFATIGSNQGFAERVLGFGIYINWLGFWTLYLKEVRRFLNVYTQTIVAPVTTSLLFLAIFLLASSNATRSFNGYPYVSFLGPGLIIMAMAQNAFMNTSSSLVIAKVQGNIVDVLMPPLSAIELTLAFALSGMSRGLVVGLAVGLTMAPFVHFPIHDFGLILYYGVMGSLMLSLIGILGGVWSEKFDHIAAVTNFIVTPLSFLSGTFYSIDRLPLRWRALADWNPFFYMIDGFRSGFLGVSDFPVLRGIVIVLMINLLLGALCYRVFAIGYKLKA